jgi:hypothetical protein
VFEGPALSRVDGFALAQTDDRSFLAIVVSNSTKLRTKRIIYAD